MGSIFSVALLYSSLVSACIYKRAHEEEQWGYTGAIAPMMWHTLSENNTACAVGNEQSPINVHTGISTVNGTSMSGNVSEFLVFNNGHTIEAEPETAGIKSILEGEEFVLDQFHFHSPSEHRMNEEYYPLEVHLVHTNEATGANAVIGVFFDISATGSDPLFQSLNGTFEEVRAVEAETQVSGLDLSSVMRHISAATVRTYAGSLTTPPCTEGVSWYVVQEPLQISVATYSSLKSVLGFNSRYTQGNIPASKNILASACGSMPAETATA